MTARQPAESLGVWSRLQQALGSWSRTRPAAAPIGRRGYAICTQQRSGSNLLCQCLSSTGRLGHPLEYFNGPARRALGVPDFPDDARGQIDLILQRGATPNGIYGVKLFAAQHDRIAASVGWITALPELRFVYLERRDLLGQALSLARATQTGQFRSSQRPARTPAYDGALILSMLHDIVRERARWEAYFARTGIEPLRMAYEDVVADPLAQVRRVADLMELEEAVTLDRARVDLSVQRDQLSEHWRRCFLGEHGDPNRIDPI